MKGSIKERATERAIKDTAKGRARKDYCISAMADHENGFREGYIKGAYEQQVICTSIQRKKMRQITETICSDRVVANILGIAENTRFGRETQIKALKKLLKQEIEAI